LFTTLNIDRTPDRKRCLDPTMIVTEINVQCGGQRFLRTASNTYAQSYVLANIRKAGSAVTDAELKKLHKYQDISTSVDFIPIAIESSGVWGQHAMELVSEIGRRLNEVSHEPRSTSFLRHRLAVAVQRGNASCIIGTLKINHHVK